MKMCHMRNLIYRISLTGLYFALDWACIFGSVFLGYATYRFLGIGKSMVYETAFLLELGLVLAIVVCGTMHLFGAYARESGILNVKEIRSVMMGILGSLIIVNAFFALTRFLPSRYFVLLCFLYMLFLLPLARSIIYAILTDHLPEAIVHRVLIYGAGELGRRLYREIYNSPRLHIQVCGFIDDDPSKKGLGIFPCGFQTNNHHCRVMGNREDLPRLVRTHRIDEVYVAVSFISNERLKALFAQCNALGVGIAFIPCLHEIFAHRVRIHHVGNLPLVREQKFLTSRQYDRAKRAMDLGLCVLIGIPLLPVLAIVAAAIKLDSPGPVLFKHKRVGMDGRHFSIYKFRSMFAETPEYSVNPYSHEDPRITRVGRFLRRTSLDELPQVLNVLKGEMSLVGPRPEMPFIVEQYEEVHKERLKAIPGITGLWQLSGDRRRAIHENMDYDLYYIYNRSFFLDVTILLQTLIFAFRGI
jgi:exopolysaccharide biosynthesis polyprenyl glycosylphosphotransferase